MQARWITVCSNILRLYMQTAKPSQKLIKLVKYIVLVYCPILFDIKWKPEATNGKPWFQHLHLATACLQWEETENGTKLFGGTIRPTFFTTPFSCLEPMFRGLQYKITFGAKRFASYLMFPRRHILIAVTYKWINDDFYFFSSRINPPIQSSQV